MILREPDPVLTVELFPPMRTELIRILTNLTDEQWNYPTACTGWSVKDVALHLLGDDVGILSGLRDGFRKARVDVNSFEQLVAVINMRNDMWIRAARRISPELLIQLLEVTGEGFYEWIRTLDLDAPGGTVNWASDKPAPQWLEIAREYTEQWMHHQHICDALGITSLKERQFFEPLINTFIRALPRTYAKYKAPLETLVQVEITGEGGNTWYLLRERGGWNLYAHINSDPTCTITLEDETAWRLFTKGIGRKEAEPHVQIEGDMALGEVFFDTVSIMA